MTVFSPKPRAALCALVMGAAITHLHASWGDPSAGLPWLEYIPSKVIGPGESKWDVVEDKWGRLFAGGDGLHVFDGQGWRTFPAGNATGLHLALDENGRIWAAAIHEAGYFEEESLGVFKFHSLMSRLSAADRLVGDAWGCTPMGRVTYFFFRDKILRWDGASLQLQPFPGASRLFPFEFEGQTWFHHLESGLYRLGESGPHLEIPAAELPPTGILGLARDDRGLVVASGLGICRPGTPTRVISPVTLNEYLAEHRLGSYLVLPDGNYVITTLHGIIFSRKNGEILRIVDENSGLPTPTLNSMHLDRSGRAWAGAFNGILNFEGAGNITVFNAFNGLKGRVNHLLPRPDGRLLAGTMQGVFQLEAPAANGARFKPILGATGVHLLATAGGVLNLRHGGIDFLESETNTRTVVNLTGAAAYLGARMRNDPAAAYIFESNGLFQLRAQPDGSFEHTLLAKLPHFVSTVHEDTTGRLWLGTYAQGAFTYQKDARQLSPVLHPATGQPLSGLTLVQGLRNGLLILSKDSVLLADATGSALTAMTGAPLFNPIVAVPTPEGTEGVLVAFKRGAASTKSPEGVGVLTLRDSGSVAWQELEIPALTTIGSINTMVFTQENDRSILWIGGAEGLLRLDYRALPVISKPASPIIQLDLLHCGRALDQDGFAFSFTDHRLNFHVFTGNYVRSKDWMVQTRLGGADWSAPVSRRTFEFTHLSEGEYRFEVRTINGAGLTSEAAGFAFRILPPWYRSRWAYAGYFALLLVGVMGFIRVRERRIQARNAELEGLVSVRTAELVKANAAKDEFLAGISHEIRNPMNGVIGIAENFRTDALDLESRRKFSLLRQCAHHLSSLLEDILDFSKVQAGAIELDPKPFDLPELVESVVGITRADSEKYGIPVELAVSPAVPRGLIGDARRVRQILINFVSNALKFSGRGQVSVTVWCKEAGPNRTEVIFAVSDEGPGISPEEQTRLFTRFERGAAAQRGRVPGTGLGLALCKGLAEKMGGRIWLESELGRGSCFYFSAPFPVIATATGAPVAGEAPPAAARAALVVDDQEYNRIVLTDLLQSLGFNVHSVQEGQAALDAAARKAFDVIFLDFNLPGLSGVDVARGIRSLSSASAHALILATTAFNTPEKRAQCLDAGMDAFLGKPVTRERLTKALAGLATGPASAPTRGTPPAAVPSAIPAARPPAGPADRLGNLRLLAQKKGVTLAAELAAYFAELDAELAQLTAALAAENADEAARYAHLLCGRCSFIYERELEQVQREVEAAIVDRQWAKARRHRDEFAGLLAVRRVSLVSADPTAPRG